MIMPDQLISAEARNRTELVVYIGDRSRGIGDRHNRMFIQRRLYITQLPLRRTQVALELLAFTITRRQEIVGNGHLVTN